MRLTRPLRPKKVTKIDPRILKELTKTEKAELMAALKARKNLNLKRHKIRFFKH